MDTWGICPQILKHITNCDGLACVSIAYLSNKTTCWGRCEFLPDSQKERNGQNASHCHSDTHWWDIMGLLNASQHSRSLHSIRRACHFNIQQECFLAFIAFLFFHSIEGMKKKCHVIKFNKFNYICFLKTFWKLYTGCSEKCVIQLGETIGKGHFGEKCTCKCLNVGNKKLGYPIIFHWR